MKKYLILIILFPMILYADRVSLTFENDCLLKHADNDYTHGTELEYVYNDLWYFKVQQNMYTPSDLKRTDHIVGDRPYAGWLGMEIGRELFKDDNSPWSHYLGVNFGVIGKYSYAKETQKLIHKLLDCKEPKGWKNQLADEFCINIQYWIKYNWYLCDYVAIIPRVGILAGTLQDAMELGCDLKIGWNIRKDVGNNMMLSASMNKGSFWDNLSTYLYVGPDCRYYLYNHMFQGSLFNKHDRDLDVDIHPFVGELQFGIGLEVYNFFARWYGCVRTDEFKNQPNSPDYGGLVIGWSW